MSLSEVPYLRWAKNEQRAGDYQLTYSAVPPVDWETIGLDPAELKLFDYTRYGPESFLEALCAEGNFEPQQVLLASSATHAHFCFAASILIAGDRVLYESPGYLPLVDSLSMLDVEPIRFLRRFEDGYRLPCEALSMLVEQACPRILLLTSVHNPSGVALTPEETDFLDDLCERTGIIVLCDDVYRPFLDPDPGPLAQRHPGIISVNSLNKSYGLPQIRVGWGFAEPRLVERARRVLDATTVHNSCLSDQVAEAAWQHREALVERARHVAKQGWDVVGPWLEQSPLECVAPDAGLVCFPRLPEGNLADADAARDAFLKVGVGVTPGTFFEDPRHFRLGFGVEPPVLEEALRRLESAF